MFDRVLNTSLALKITRVWKSVREKKIDTSFSVNVYVECDQATITFLLQNDKFIEAETVLSDFAVAVLCYFVFLGIITIKTINISQLQSLFAISCTIKLFLYRKSQQYHIHRTSEMDFKVVGPWKTGKYRRQEKFLNSRRSRMAKTVTYWPC